MNKINIWHKQLRIEIVSDDIVICHGYIQFYWNKCDWKIYLVPHSWKMDDAAWLSPSYLHSSKVLGCLLRENIKHWEWQHLLWQRPISISSTEHFLLHVPLNNFYRPRLQYGIQFSNNTSMVWRDGLSFHFWHVSETTIGMMFFSLNFRTKQLYSGSAGKHGTCTTMPKKWVIVTFC